MEIIKYIKGLADKTPTNIRSNLYMKGILSTYHLDGRMIVYMSKNQRFNRTPEYKNPMYKECNGMVIDVIKSKILVTPPESFRSSVDKDVVNANLHMELYDIYRVEDGTMINLYYWEPLKSWRISTNRSLDITDIKWGKSSYSEILTELFEMKNRNIDDFYKSLDTDRCYTLGFKHASMHPFQEGTGDSINRLWFIQSVKNGNVSYEFTNEFQIQSQTKFEFPEGVAKTTEYLFGGLNTSLENFTSCGNILYGYILRSRNNTETGSHSSILLESSLLQNIRKLYYHSIFNEVSKKLNYDRELYTVICAYLDINTHSTFIALFPQYCQQYNKLDTITSNLVKSVIIYTNKPNELNTTDYIHDCVKFIYESINARYKLVPYDRRNIQLISTFLLSNTFIHMYYSLASTSR
jgi:hypothetical protein